MSLQNILINTGGGFVAGLGLGLYGLWERLEERFNFLENLGSKEVREERKRNKKFKKTKRELKFMKYTLPFFVSSYYSFIAAVATSSQPAEKMIVAVPAAYAGKFVGGCVRKYMKRKKQRKEEETLAQALRDPENMDRYLLPPDKSEIIREAFSEIERKILDGEEPEKVIVDPKGPATKIHNIILKKPTAYTSRLFDWSLARHKEIVERAITQRRLTEFYEKSFNEMSPANCVLIGTVDKPKLKIFMREGDKFYMQTAEWINLRFVRHDETEIVEAEGVMPQVTTEEKRKWEGNYKELTDMVLKEKKNFPVMLVKALPEMPNDLKTEFIASNFLPELEKHYRSNL